MFVVGFLYCWVNWCWRCLFKSINNTCTSDIYAKGTCAWSVGTEEHLWIYSWYILISEVELFDTDWLSLIDILSLRYVFTNIFLKFWTGIKVSWWLLYLLWILYWLISITVYSFLHIVIISIASHKVSTIAVKSLVLEVVEIDGDGIHTTVLL